jgi:hypothetical protein
MPNYIAMMWMRAADGGIAAVVYGPGRLETSVGSDATPLTITATTRYPYQQSVDFDIQPAQPATFALHLRIPAWCQSARLTVNGKGIAAKLHPGTFYALKREWHPGDKVSLALPFGLAIETWPRGGVSLTYGPLTLALPIQARAEIEKENSTVQQRKDALEINYQPRPVVVKKEFPAWNLYPQSDWNYALCLDEQALKQVQVEWNEHCVDPFDAANPPLKVRIKARKVSGWRIIHTHRTRQSGHWTTNGKFTRGVRTIQGDFHFTPALPDPEQLQERLSPQVEEIELIPYAATLLRIAVFPRG